MSEWGKARTSPESPSVESKEKETPRKPETGLRRRRTRPKLKSQIDQVLPQLPLVRHLKRKKKIKKESRLDWKLNVSYDSKMWAILSGSGPTVAAAAAATEGQGRNF